MSRTRKKSNGSKGGLLTERYRSYGPPVGSWSYGTPRSTVLYSNSAVMNDTISPQYRSRVARGEVITNAMDFTETTVKSEGGWTYHRRGGAGNLEYEVTGEGSLYDWSIAGHLGGDGGNPGFPSVTQRESNSIARAKQKALASVDPSPVSIGQDLAEIRQSLELLRNPLSFIGKRTSDYQRKASLLKETVKRKSRLDAQLRDAFLQYQYGVAPLWRSVMSVISEVTQPRRRDSQKLLAAHGSDKDDGSWAVVLNRGSGYTQPWSRDWTFEARATVLYRLNNPVEDWRSRFGLRTKDLPTILWEVQTLSFMVDRIFDVRSCIKGLMNLSDPSVTILADKCSYSIRRRTNESKTLNLANTGGWPVHDVRFDRKTSEVFVYSRSLWTPTAGDIIPRENLSGLVKSATNVAELLALIHSGLGIGGRSIH